MTPQSEIEKLELSPVANKLKISTMAALIDDSESKSPSKIDSNKKDENDSDNIKFELCYSIYLNAKGKREENEFKVISAMFESSKAMVDGIVQSGLLKGDDVSLVKNTIDIKYKGFNYRIEHKDYKVDADEQEMESCMQLYYSFIII